jgi:hypothetical protein
MMKNAWSPQFGLRSLCLIITALLVFAGISRVVLLNCADAADTPGLKLEVAPVKQIYSNREGLMVKFILTARTRTKLCLAKDLLSQMQVDISRSGVGKLPLQPLVLRDNSALFSEKLKIHWLEPGESLTLRANLKRYRFNDGEVWKPGDYSVGATFNLCEQTADEQVMPGGKEVPVRSVRQGWFMIMS